MKKLFATIISSAIIIILLLSGCSDSSFPEGSIPSSAWTSGQTSIKLLGASWYAENNYIHVFYSIEATNKSSRSFDGSAFNIVCLDEFGHNLFSSSGFIMPIASGDTVQFSNSFKYIGCAPASIDIRFTDNIGMYSDDKVPYHSNFQISDVHTSSNNAFYMISGTITNNSAQKEGIMVSAIFSQNGQIIGGASTFADPVEAGKSGAFTIYLPHFFEECNLHSITANIYL